MIVNQVPALDLKEILQNFFVNISYRNADGNLVTRTVSRVVLTAAQRATLTYNSSLFQPIDYYLYIQQDVFQDGVATATAQYLVSFIVQGAFLYTAWFVIADQPRFDTETIATFCTPISLSASATFQNDNYLETYFMMGQQPISSGYGVQNDVTYARLQYLGKNCQFYSETITPNGILEVSPLRCVTGSSANLRVRDCCCQPDVYDCCDVDR